MCRILIVDDEKQYCLLLKRALACDGLQVTTTSDSNEAAERLRTQQFDLLISDIDMPDWTGLDLANLATGLSVPPKVLLITAQKGLLGATGDLKAFHCLLKPFYLSDLRAKVALLTGCWHILPVTELPGRGRKKPLRSILECSGRGFSSVSGDSA